MKATTAKLLEELKQVTEDLLYISEGDYSIEPFVWEVEKKDKLTLDKLLQSEGFLRQVEIEQVFPQNLKFFQSNLSDEMQMEDRKQLEVIDFLQSRCQSLEAYLVQKNDGSDANDGSSAYEEFPLILAETQIGEWIGVAPEVNAYFETRPNAERLVISYDPRLEKDIWESAFRKVEDIPPQNRADFYVRFDLKSLLRSIEAPLFSNSISNLRVIDFLSRNEKEIEKLLKQAARQRDKTGEAALSLAAEIKEYLVGMKLFTRQLYEPHQPIDRFVMKAAASKELLISNLVDAMGFSRVCQFTEFSQEAELYDEDPEEKRYYASLEPLDRILISNLSNLREYVVGCESVFYLYDVGQNSDGDWVGVSTIATWT